MKISLNWLRELVELPPTVAELVDLLTLAGVEVEHVETSGAAIDKVVVAQILESVQHPNADRLSVCKVDDGSGAPRQIVCGAKNYKVGDKAPLALPGAVLPGDFKIKVGKLRGVDSEGMLCSGKELNIADDADGLLILPQSARVGAPISELYPADTVLELEITPNRPDLLSYIGIAREVAALTRKNFQSPIDALKMEGLSQFAQLEVTAANECPLYTARKINGVKVGAGPDWLKRKLEASGIRSINNIVDITNFVMLETGQPLHAFDADKLEGAIRVRMANEGEEFLALDGRTYKLTPENLVIADQRRAVAVAGVMGGEETGVTETTANVILESALFLASNIRRTARRLGLMSDSSYRFERGVDMAGVMIASARAAQLIAEIAGGVPAGWMFGIGEGSSFGFSPSRAASEAGWKIEIIYTRSVPLRSSRVKQVLGAEISESRIDEILAAFQLKKEGDGWRIPSFRQDLTREIDLIEEITRVYGIGNIPARGTSRYVESTATDREHDRDMKLRRSLAAQGFCEARTLSLVGENAAQHPPEVRRVRNPLNSDQVVLRPNLLGGLLAVVANNARAGNKTLRLFELGRVFRADKNEERTHLAFVMTGAVAEKSWRAAADRNEDIFDAKGILSSLGLGELKFEAAENPLLALAAAVKLNGRQIGCAGQLWPAKARDMDITAPVIAVEIELPAPKTAVKKYTEIPKYPAVTRDFAMAAPGAVTHAQVEAVLQKLNEPLLERVELFDVFTDPEGKKVAAGQKSMAYSLTYRAKNRTLTVDEVNAAHARIKDRLKAELGVTFRE